MSVVEVVVVAARVDGMTRVSRERTNYCANLQGGDNYRLGSVWTNGGGGGGGGRLLHSVRGIQLCDGRGEVLLLRDLAVAQRGVFADFSVSILVSLRVGLAPWH